MDEFETIKTHYVFNAMVVEQMGIWAAAENTPERIKLKYQAMLEASATDFFQAMVNPNVPVRDRTELLKTVMRGANVGNDTQAALAAAGNGNRVSITINLGDSRISIAKDVTHMGNDDSVLDLPASPPMGKGVPTSINRNEEIKELARKFVADNLPPQTPEEIDYATILDGDFNGDGSQDEAG